MDIMVSQFVLFVLVFVRVTSLLIVAPLIGDQNVPVQVKVAVGLFMSLVFLPIASPAAGAIDTRLIPLVITVVKEIAVGLIVGFASNLVFAGIRFAGELISFDLGTAMASMFDPENNQNMSVIGEFLHLVMVLVFLAVNGHHFIFQAIAALYRAVPVGGLSFEAPIVDHMIRMTGMVFLVAVKIAAPVIVASFLTNVALSVLSRVVPQMNIFTVSFPLKIGVGFAVLVAAAPLMIYVFRNILSDFENNVLQLVKLV
jgi:flagellar biosynthesis protein FliR